MKNWNIGSLKFVSEMYNAVAHFFGADSEDATEAELHQKLVEAGTLENIRAAALKEANEAVTAQMSDFKTQLETLQSQFADLKADADAKGEKVTELETELETVRGDVAARETAIAGHLAQIKLLSGEVASLKAGKPLDKSAPPDGSIPETGKPGANGARTVSMKDLEAALAN